MNITRTRRFIIHGCANVIYKNILHESSCVIALTNDIRNKIDIFFWLKESNDFEEPLLSYEQKSNILIAIIFWFDFT